MKMRLLLLMTHLRSGHGLDAGWCRRSRSPPGPGRRGRLRSTPSDGAGEPHGAAGELIGPHGGRRQHEPAVEIGPELIAIGRVVNHPPEVPAVTVEEEGLGASEWAEVPLRRSPHLRHVVPE